MVLYVYSTDFTLILYLFSSKLDICSVYACVYSFYICKISLCKLLLLFRFPEGSKFKLASYMFLTLCVPTSACIYMQHC